MATKHKTSSVNLHQRVGDSEFVTIMYVQANWSKQLQLEERASSCTGPDQSKRNAPRGAVLRRKPVAPPGSRLHVLVIFICVDGPGETNKTCRKNDGVRYNHVRSSSNFSSKNVITHALDQNKVSEMFIEELYCVENQWYLQV